MASNAKPILHAISAFDAEFGNSGKENISAPIFNFSWENGVVVHKNRVVIRNYSSNEIVYDYTIASRALKHQLIKTDNLYNLKNGEKYIANVYVYTSDNKSSLASNDVIFYCYNTPTFRFTNFSSGDYMGSGTTVAIVTNSSVNLTVEYSQSNNEPLSRYSFELKDHNNITLHSSETKYSTLSNDILRYTIGGITETTDDDLNNNRAYTIICSGETQHGIYVYTEQKFVVKLGNSGVGSLVKAENTQDGTVLIHSNYKIVNAECSVENPIYIYDENNNPCAINLLNNEYVEFIDGYLMKNPYEIIFNGRFKVGRLFTLRNLEGEYAYISLKKITYTTKPFYYFSFEINRGNMSYEVRSNYFMYASDLITAEIDFVYNNGLYNIKANVTQNNDKFYVYYDKENEHVTITFFGEYNLAYDNSEENTTVENEKLICTVNEESITIS